MQTGIVIAGAVVPGTDFVKRDPEAWWADGEHGTRPRSGPASILVGHWTAGHPRTGDDAAKKVVHAMKSRRKNGHPLEVGIHFVIGWDGGVFQTADLGVATVHVGEGPVIARSIGVETCWPGTVKQAQALHLPTEPSQKVRVAGGPVRALLPSAALLGAWVKLADALAAIPRLAIPKKVPARPDGLVLRDRFTVSQQAAWKGAQEHLHIRTTTKVDAGGFLMQALADAGWALTKP